MKITTVPKSIRESISRVSLWCIQKEAEFLDYFKSKYPNVEIHLSFDMKDSTNEGLFRMWIMVERQSDVETHADPEVLFLWADSYIEKFQKNQNQGSN